MEFGGFEVEQLGSEGLGDAGGGVQLTGEFTASGFTFPVSFALQFVRVDRALVAVVTSGVGPTSRPPTELPCSRSLSTA